MTNTAKMQQQTFKNSLLLHFINFFAILYFFKFSKQSAN